MAAQMRDLLEEAFANYSGEKASLRTRLRALDNKTHLGAVFELLLHELALRQNLNPEADTPLAGGLPDQRITLPTGGHAFVECRMLEPGNHGLYDQLCDAIDAAPVPGILYYVRLKVLPTRSLSARRIKTDLTRQMRELDISNLSPKWLDNKAHGFQIKDEEKVVLEIIPFARPGSAGGVGMMDGVRNDFVTPESFRRGLERKNQRYRDADAPYIIAICSAKSYAEDEDVEEALFRQGSGEHRGFFVRSPRANVSAVLACQRWKPSGFDPTMKLYLNPNAERPLTSNPFGCDTVERRDGASAEKRGRSFQTLMGLPEAWPGE